MSLLFFISFSQFLRILYSEEERKDLCVHVCVYVDNSKQELLL